MSLDDYCDSIGAKPGQQTDMTDESDIPACSAILVITGAELEPENVTYLLNLTPDRSWRRGERKSFPRTDGSIRYFESVYSDGGWKRFLPSEVQDLHLDEQLAYWADTLAGRSEAMRTLLEQGFGAEINCCMVTGTAAEVQIPAERVSDFARRGVDIRITFYPHQTHRAEDDA